MLISQAFPRRFATGEDLAGKTPVLAVAKVTTEKVGPVVKPVVWFHHAAKGIVLNPTLARQLAALLGDDTDAWAGRRVQLSAVKIKVNGEVKHSIRASAAPAPADDRAPDPGAAPILPTRPATLNPDGTFTYHDQPQTQEHQ